MMKLANITVIITSMLTLTLSVRAQQAADADSLWMAENYTKK